MAAIEALHFPEHQHRVQFGESAMLRHRARKLVASSGLQQHMRSSDKKGAGQFERTLETEALQSGIRHVSPHFPSALVPKSIAFGGLTGQAGAACACTCACARGACACGACARGACARGVVLLDCLESTLGLVA